MANDNDEVQKRQQQRRQQQQQPKSNNSNSNSGAASGEKSGAVSRQSEKADKHKALSATAVVKIDGAVDTAEEGTQLTCMRAKLNDLVADLCMKDTTAWPHLGDCTNIRATGGAQDFVEGLPAQQHDLPAPDLHTSAALSASQATHTQPQPTQNSSFSFKHFLSSGGAMTAPSTTVTSLDHVGHTSSSVSSANGVNNASVTCNSNLHTAASYSTHSLQSSTGARPKVPQSACGSSSATSFLTLKSGLSASAAEDCNNSFAAAATKMKRSPRFCSFDSQASLAEYVDTGNNGALDGGFRALSGGGTVTSSNSSSGFRLCPDALSGESSDFFAATNNSGTVTASSNYERQYVPRSHSNYEMPMPVASPRRRLGLLSAKEARPNRLALNTQPACKLKLDLPIDNNNSASGGSARPLPNNAGEFPAAAALPDFVQDHWLDSWYAHEMHLNSPPNSPICDFVEDLTGAGVASGGGIDAVGAAATCGGPPSGAPAIVRMAGGGVATNEPTGASSKMLPDFLSDGPIIHSSQRLADVAAGLPSNSMGSPEDPSMSSQLSRMRSDNERLQRELQEARVALNTQTQRAHELERQLQERKRNDEAINRSMSENISLVEESLDKSKQRTAAAQSHVTKLKQQVTRLTAEVETLRRENDMLREEGAVGGCATASCDRSYITAAATAAATASAAAAAAGSRANASRPSKTQELSRDLLMAAANAENNLRQLLVGVDNLRQMAADIENAELPLDFDVSPDLFSDFIDDCDDYEEYSGGPAL